MGVFEQLGSMGHEEVVFFNDRSCGLKAIVAIHDTTLGPALGGCRLWPYVSEEEALEDVLRLSRGMTYKASVSGLNLGGGKAVIIGNPREDKSEALFRSFGRCIESLNGRYITAEDVNISVADVEYIFTETSHVVGVDKVRGGSGNPAPYTALGVLRGIEACCQWVFGSRSVAGKTVAIQGCGSVGTHLAHSLVEHKANVIYADIDQEHAQRFAAEIPSARHVNPDEIYSVDCDIFSPCALGAVINDQTIEQLRCQVVAGAANNQLSESRHGAALKKRGILYAPDYLINAGGLMNVSIEHEGHSDEQSHRMIDAIYDTTLRIFAVSDQKDISVNLATNLIAEKRIEEIKRIKTNYLGNTHHKFPRQRSRHCSQG